MGADIVSASLFVIGFGAFGSVVENQYQSRLTFLVPFVLRTLIDCNLSQSAKITLPFAVLDKLAGSVTDDSNPQLAKALLPMVVTELGSIIDVNEVHPWKQLSPKVFTLLGIAIVVSEVQFLNAPLWMLSRVFGSTIVLRELHSKKALSPIDVRFCGRITDVSDSHSQNIPSLTIL